MFDLRQDLRQRLDGTPYWAYSYSYPHKTAYRPLDRPLPLQEVWAGEDVRALFVYVHIPFCEMRCGFCNLFTMAKPREGLNNTYVGTLRRQARQVRRALDAAGTPEFVRLAVGGGTPTQLDVDALAEVFDLLHEELGADGRALPTSCEVSPETVTPEKLALLRERGVDRLSMGVQSFVEQETKAARRPQQLEIVHEALRLIQAAGFPTRNLDLIYGLPHQTPESWAESIEACLAYEPEEIFLYPLYVRPLTGLGNSPKQWDDLRRALYRQGRDMLLARGYRQSSMRLFVKPRPDAPAHEALEYRCQRDGMIGLGVGARSYTERLHYSAEYAVGRRGVVSIIEDFVARDDEALAHVNYGVQLSDEERRRRHAILSLLSSEGLDAAFYTERFGEPVEVLFGGELEALAAEELVWRDGQTWRLTARGLEWSDVIGPWLYSEPVRTRMDAFELR